MSLGLLVFTSAADTALTGIRRLQARRSLSASAEAQRDLDVTLGDYQASLVVVRLVIIICAVTMAALLAVGVLGAHWWSVAIGGLVSALLVLAAEVPVRPLVASKPEAFVEKAAVPLAVLSTLTRPMTQLIPMSPETPFIRKEGQAQPEATEEDSTPADVEEFREMVTELEETPELREDEIEMIDGVLGLKETSVKEIMAPRPDFIAVPVDAGLPEAIALMAKTGRTHIPLYEGSLDNIVGVVHAQDVLKRVGVLKGAPLRQVARAPFFVPETKNVYQLLEEFRQTGTRFALVVDEYGGVEGLVTLNDVLEEIVGGVVGEHGPHAPAIRALSETEAIVDGAVSLEEVNEALDVELESDRIDTIGGFVLHHLGHMPEPGETVRVDGILAEVLSTAGRRVKRLRIAKVPVTAPETAPA